MNVRTILSLALVAFVFALGGCATASRDSSYDSKADGTVKKTEKATCTGWGCSDTSTSRRHAPTVYVPGQYAQGYLGGYDTGIGRAYGYGHQVGDTPRDLAAQGFTYTPPNGYVQGLRKQWSYAQRVPAGNGFALICWPKTRPLGTNDQLADGTPICKDGL